MITKVLTILKGENQKSLIVFFLKSLSLNILDLISIAYLIPIITLLLDKEKFYSVLDKIGIPPISINDTSIQVGVIILIAFFVIKNIIYTNFNRSLFGFLYDLSNSLSIKNLRSFIFQDFLFYQKQNKGDLINIVMRVTGDFCSKFLHSLILLSSEFIVLLIVTGFLFYFYPIFTLFALIVLGAFSVLIYYKKKSEFNIINTTYGESQAASNSSLINILDGYLEIRSSNNENYFLGIFEKHNSKLNKVTAMLVSSSFNYSKYLEVSLVICLGAVSYFSFISTGADILLISTLAALGFKLVPSLSKILNAITHIKSHYYTVQTLYDIQENEIYTKDQPISALTSELRFENVSFNYPGGKQILKGVEFNIRSGSFIGITGVSGIGKTTLLYLTMGLLKPTNGRILIDDHSFKGKNLLNIVGYAPQQPFLLSGTLLENITMGQEEIDVDHEFIRFLSDRLQLSSLIEDLPSGFKTYIQHDSMRFSGGQKQRISLLRALYRKPQLLILDETTNQLNNNLELDIFQFLKDHARDHDMTVISISHSENLDQFYDETYKIADKNLIQID